jgi:hypothetical protein
LPSVIPFQEVEPTPSTSSILSVINTRPWELYTDHFVQKTKIRDGLLLAIFGDICGHIHRHSTFARVREGPHRQAELVLMCAPDEHADG